MGLGRSLALPGMRLRAENPAQVCRWTYPLTPLGARGGDGFLVQVQRSVRTPELSA